MIRAFSPSQNISFGKLKFELDKPTKEYLLKLSSEDDMSNSDILEIVQSTDLMMHNLTAKANNIAQSLIDDSSLKGKSLEDVWSNDKIVKINVKPQRRTDDTILLNAYFNDNFYNSEDEGNLYNHHGENRTKVRAIDLWGFISSLGTSFGDSLQSFVSKNLKKDSKFCEMEKAIQQNQNVNIDKDDEIAKQKLKKWLNL